MTDIDRIRRRLLLGGASLLGTGLPAFETGAAGWRAEREPFLLGVASGDPSPDGFVIWTRLAPEPLQPAGGMPPQAVSVEWEVAADPGFRTILRTGRVTAHPEWAHAVHVEVAGLEPARWYWYRFRAGGAESQSGRSRTLAAPGAAVGRVTMAVVSCQNYEDGYFSAYRHLVRDDLDLVVHLGDYIYESVRGSKAVRAHLGPPPATLAQYRLRHAQYRLDPDLQAAHAACPWLLIPDDHDVQNDYAGDQGVAYPDVDAFLRRRAAAYQAWYEHLPVRAARRPAGSIQRMYRRIDIGDLVSMHLLDVRQYRSDQACQTPTQGGGRVADCAERLLEERTMLGFAQERWLAAQLRQDPRRWTCIAQPLLMAPVELQPGPEEGWWTDGWDGYPAARERLLAELPVFPASRSIVLSGDVHSFWANELHREAHVVDAVPAAVEFVTSSISASPVVADEALQRQVRAAAHVHYAESRYRGYLHCVVTPQAWEVECRAIESVARPDARMLRLRRFRVGHAEGRLRPA